MPTILCDGRDLLSASISDGAAVGRVLLDGTRSDAADVGRVFSDPPNAGFAGPGLHESTSPHPLAHHFNNSATATVVVASSNGSVIGVDCRYRTFGFSAKTAEPAMAAIAEPVSQFTIHAIAAAAIAYSTTDKATADAPVR